MGTCRVTFLFCRPTQEPTWVKLRRGFGKMQVNGPEGQQLARKKFLAVAIAGMAIYRPAPDLKGIAF